MKKIRGSDIKLLTCIREKMDWLDCIEMGVEGMDMEDGQTGLGYAFMEQIETLKQIKGLESSIFNDQM